MHNHALHPPPTKFPDTGRFRTAWVDFVRETQPDFTQSAASKLSWRQFDAPQFTNYPWYIQKVSTPFVE